jgi:hypothetical protein
MRNMPVRVRSRIEQRLMRSQQFDLGRWCVAPERQLEL